MDRTWLRAQVAAPGVGWFLTEIAVLLSAVAWLVSGQLWALLTWEVLAVVYLLGGLALAWGGSTDRVGSSDDARLLVRFSWIAPLLSAAVGGFSALRALASTSTDTSAVTLAVAASVAVVISWAMLNSGFAEIYQYLDEAREDARAIEFDGEDPDAFLNYLYFAFSVGAGFTTSDATVRTLAVRRVVLLHGIAAFLFNALLIATALEVFQRLVD